MKERAESEAKRDVERCSAAKQRRLRREVSVCSSSSNAEVDNDEPIALMMKSVLEQRAGTISIQTDVPMTEFTALELDNQSRQEEVSSGYPTREQLQADKKLLLFYTGIPHFTILLALYEFVIKVLSVSANSELGPFDSSY